MNIKPFFKHLRLSLQILAMGILVLAAILWQKQSEKAQRMTMACFASSETSRQRSEGILRDLKEKLEATQKERDDLKRQLESIQSDAGDEYYRVPFSTEVFGQVAIDQNYLYLLDKGRIGEVKDSLNLDLDGFIGILETMIQTSKDEEAKAGAKKNLVRIAKYRKENPPAVGKNYPFDPEVNKNVTRILEKALKEYQ